MPNRTIELGLAYTENILPRRKWEWLLFIFIVSSLTLSYIEGASLIVKLYGMLFAGLFLVYFLYHKLSFNVPSEIILYSLWIIWSLGGLVNAMDKSLYFSTLSTIIQLWILLFLVTSIISLHRNISAVMLSIAFGGIIVGVFSVISGDFQQAIQMGVRSKSLTGNANEFAYVLLFVIVAMFYFLGPGPSLRPIRRIIFSMIIVTSFVFIIFSGSRKGLMGSLVFVCLWWLFCQPQKISRTKIKGFLILVLVLGGIYYSAHAVMSSKTMGERLQNIDDPSDRARIQMYLDGLEILKRYPIFGVGLDNYRLLSTSGLYSHSDYIETASTTGIIGFILYFSIYWVLLRRLSRLKKVIYEPRMRYIIGLLRATIITMLLIAFGRPNITSKITWIFLAGAIGYSASLERSLVLFKRKNIA